MKNAIILTCLDSLIFYRGKRASIIWYAITLIIPFTTLIIKPPFTPPYYSKPVDPDTTG